jgi:hypothetical protein
MATKPASSNVVPFTGPVALDVWPIPGDAPNLKTIVQDQATTMTAQAALIDAYQDWLNTEQTPPAATANGTSTGTTSITLSSVAGGPILNGTVVTGTGVPTTPATTVVSQQSGTWGGNGTYTLSAATTLTNVALTFTPGGGPMPWPTPTDSNTLNTIQQQQTSILRSQTALLQQYQDLLNTSLTPAPPTGP